MEVYLFLWKSKIDWDVEYVTNTQPFGYNRDDITLGIINYLDIIHPEDKNKVIKNFNSYHRIGHDNIILQYRVITNSGDVRWVNEKIVIHDDAESPQQYLSIIVDVTDQKRIEKEHQRALAIKDELESIINKSPVVVFQWKPEGKLEETWPVEFVSDNIARFGYKADEFYTGKLQYGDIIHHDDLERVQYELSERRDKGHDNFSQEYRIITKSGEICWVDERTFIQRDEYGNTISYQGIIVDITERKQTENLLHTEHDIAFALNDSGNPEDILNQVLELTLNIGTVDCGCIHFTDVYNNLNLVTHTGLSTNFVNDISYMDSNSILNRIIMIGQPVYKDYSEIPLKSDTSKNGNRNEKLRAVALIPIINNGEVLGSLNLASHVYDQIPADIRTAIEIIAAQLGGFISRIKTEMNLYEYQSLSSSSVPINLEVHGNKN